MFNLLLATCRCGSPIVSNIIIPYFRKDINLNWLFPKEAECCVTKKCALCQISYTYADKYTPKNSYCLSKILLNRLKKVNVVIIAASISLIGSARKTANTLFWIKHGRIKINGINRISFLRQASSRLTFACPNAIKLCWQAT